MSRGKVCIHWYVVVMIMCNDVEVIHLVLEDLNLSITIQNS